MKRFVMISVLALVFTVITMSVHAQMKTVKVSGSDDHGWVNLPAQPSTTGDPNDGKPNVLFRDNNAYIPTIGELKRFINKKTVKEGYRPWKDNEFVEIYHFSSDGKETFSFQYHVKYVSTKNPGYLVETYFKYSENPKRPQFGKPIAEHKVTKSTFINIETGERIRASIK